MLEHLPTIDRLLRDLRRADRELPEAARPEPARAILLDLAANRLRCRRVAVTSACLASGAPPTTGLRYIGELERAQLIERQPDARDGRRKWLRLTDAGEAAVAAYAGAVA